MSSVYSYDKRFGLAVPVPSEGTVCMGFQFHMRVKGSLFLVTAEKPVKILVHGNDTSCAICKTLVKILCHIPYKVHYISHIFLISYAGQV